MAPDAPAVDGARAALDVDAVFDYECQDAARAAFVDVLLFEAFPGMKQINVQVAAATGQLKRTLTRPARRVSLTR